MLYTLPVAYTDRYVPDVEAYVASLSEGQDVLLVPEHSHRQDKMAIQVWIAGHMVGYVGSEYADSIVANYPDEEIIPARVIHPVLSVRPEVLHVALSIDQIILPQALATLDLPPVHGLPLPDVCTERRVVLYEIEQKLFSLQFYYDGASVHEEQIAQLVACMDRYLDMIGHSLSGDDTRVYTMMSWLAEAGLTYLTANMDDLAPLWEDILEMHDAYDQDADAILRIMRSEKALVADVVAGMVDELGRLIKGGLVTRKQLITEIESVLRGLPDNLFAYLTDERELAQRIYRLRLPARQLYDLYSYILLYERLKYSRKQPAVAVDDGFDYWNTTDPVKRQEAIRAMVDIVNTYHRYGKHLADELSELQHRRILRPWNSKKQFITALDALLREHGASGVAYTTLAPLL